MQDTDVPREDSDVPARPHTGQGFSSANRMNPTLISLWAMGERLLYFITRYYGMFVRLSRKPYGFIGVLR